MNLQRFCVKFFAQSGYDINDEHFINIFHQWIRHQKLGGILLDVADYRHVPEGPGIMLITHEINFAMDYNHGRLGLLAQRKLGAGETLSERIVGLVQATAKFGALLEQESRLGGYFKLEGGSFHFQSNDRLLAPNTAEAFTVLQPDLAAATALIYPGRDITLTQVSNDPRDRLTVAVQSGEAVDLKSLLEVTTQVFE